MPDSVENAFDMPAQTFRANKVHDDGDGTYSPTVWIQGGTASTAPTASENHLGEVGGNSAVVVGSFTRPANTTAYASGQLVANSTTAASVTPITLAAARKNGGTGFIRRARLTKSSTSITNAQFRVHLYKTTPTPANGDGAAWSTDSALAYLGSLDVTMDKAFTDGAKGNGTPGVGSEIIFDTAGGSMNLYALIEARAAYAPASAEVWTLALECSRD